MTIINFFGNLSTLAKRAVTAGLLGSMTAVLVSCGGGGAGPVTPIPPTTTPLVLLPDSGTMYANVSQTFQVLGGQKPYTIVSNEQTVLPLNFTLNANSFSIAPNQPGVFDPSTDPNIVPFRTVIITVRDAFGAQIANTYKVLQNFLTGYGLSISTTTTCSGATGTNAPVACAGGDSLIFLQPASNGLYYAGKVMRLTANYGSFAFITDSTGITGPTITVVADSTGSLSARIRVTPNAPTQYAQFRLTDVATGNYEDINFVIVNSNGNNTALSVLPTTITLQGPDTTRCGGGIANVVVFGGQPPYTATSTNPGSISIAPPIVLRSGDSFSATISSGSACITGGKIIITDGAGAVVSVDVTTTLGTTAPILPLNVAPTSLCMRDGDNAVINITGGNPSKVINSSNTFLVTATPNTLAGPGTVNLASQNGGGALGTAVQVTVDDGSQQRTVNIVRKTLCP
ncbi:MAG: hypothetical protein ABI905_03625 [Betaproteobacteria bacterium]